MIARMAPDDAADLIVEIDQDRRARVLALLPAGQRRQIEALLGYNPATAGGLMSPDFVALAPADPVEQALRAVRGSDLGAGHAHDRLPARRRRPAVRTRCSWSRSCAPNRRHRSQDIAEHEPVSVPPMPTCPRWRAR